MIRRDGFPLYLDGPVPDLRCMRSHYRTDSCQHLTTVRHLKKCKQSKQSKQLRDINYFNQLNAMQIPNAILQVSCYFVGTTHNRPKRQRMRMKMLYTLLFYNTRYKDEVLSSVSVMCTKKIIVRSQ